MSKKKILVIDDDPIVVKLVNSLLQSRNYDVITAFDGSDGLEKAKNECPNLILLDIIMPIMDGYDVCIELKKDINTKEIPIIMLTSEESRVAIKKAYQAGADDYIIKPIILTILLAKLDKFLNKHKS